jgi:hypothetical protein
LSQDRPRTLVVLQPGYLPWLGFFDKLRRCDIFVYYDDVQFDKHGYRNRNQLKSPAGPQWLTVPVRHKGLEKPRIVDVEIEKGAPWGRKHLQSIKQWYAKAPYLQRYVPELEELLLRPWERLADLDVAIADLMCRWFGIRTQIERSSELGIEGGQSERLVNLCLHFGAERYLTGNASKDYLEVDRFAPHGIEVQWHDYQHPVYPQLHGEFVPNMSALDLLLNCGDESAAILAGDGEGSRG